MIREKTKYGVIHKNLMGEEYHVSFSNTFKSLYTKENDIVMYLIDNDYEVLDKKIFYVGGGVHKGVDTYLNSKEDALHIEPYEYIEHGVWKTKFKIKKKK
jgi:hypothetical protein